MSFDPIERWMRCRPLMLTCVCFVVGVVIGYMVGFSPLVWGGALLIALTALILFRKGVLLFSSSLLIGALITACALISPSVTPQEDVLLTGRIISEPYSRDNYARFLLEDVSADGVKLPTRVMLYLHSYEDDVLLPSYPYGTTLSVRADTYIPSPATNPHESSYADYLRREDVFLAASASVDDLAGVLPSEPSLRGAALRLKHRLNTVIYELYDERCAPLISALLLGERSLLPDELYDAFRTAGLAHLLAISGLHISCLAAALDWMMRKMRIPQIVVFVVITLFLGCYAYLVGCPVSILRAVIMYVLAALARIFGRPSDPATNLSLAAVLVLLVDPLFIADASMILSFGSVAGLILLTQSLVPKSLLRVRGILHTPVRVLTLALCASLAAQIPTLPALAEMFGEVPLYSLLANLPALPLMTAALPFAMLSVVLGCIQTGLGAPIAWCVEQLFSVLIDFTSVIAALPHASIRIPCWSAGMILLYVALCILASSVSALPKFLKKTCLVLLPLVALCACLRPLAYPAEGLEVLFLDAGQADAALIRAEDQYYLMDAGEDSTMAEYLAHSGIRPSGVFLSHPHSDHAMGMVDVLAFCPPAVIYVPCLWDDVPADEGIPEMIKSAEDMGWIVRFLEAGDTVPLSDHVTAHIHQPWEGMTDDANGASLVMSVAYGASSVLFTGDLTIEDEYAFLPDCDVLKIPHHGAKSSTSSLLLRMTSPTAAIISVGHNSYGHPAEQTLEKLNQAGISVHRTDECGALSVLLDGNGQIKITPFPKTTPSEVIP